MLDAPWPEWAACRRSCLQSKPWAKWHNDSRAFLILGVGEGLGHRGVASRQRHLLVAPGPDRASLRPGPRSLRFLRSGFRLWGGPLDIDRSDRRGSARAGDHHRVVLPFRLTRPRPLRQPGSFRHAQGLRWPCRETGRMSSPEDPLTDSSPSVASQYVAILFDIDGTLIISGGAGGASWRMAFDELYGIPADIGLFTDSGMTDPDVGRQTFAAVLHRQPSRAEFAKLLERRLYYLYQD